MKTTRQTARVLAPVLLGLLVGFLSFWLVRGSDSRHFKAVAAQALCVLDLPAGASTVSAVLTNTRPIERFHLALKTPQRQQGFSVSISGDQGVVGSVNGVTASSFGLGVRVPPGPYTVTLSQPPGGSGGTLAVAEAEPVYLTGWQIWSRSYVGLLILAAAGAFLLRTERFSRQRAFSLTAFHSLLLGFVLLFVYLLCHESGHALVQITFGHFDLARSDFWGLRGQPHSGGLMGPPLKAWQHKAISLAGPLLPTLVGFALFAGWSLPSSRKLRSARPMLNLYSSALVAMLVFPEAVCEPLYLLGIIPAEGDLVGYTASTGGPVWLVRAALGVIVLLSVLILWRVVPEVRRSWMACFLPSTPPTAAPAQPKASPIAQ